jgi:hypothetical protein
VLSVLPPVDLSALERGMQQFLEQLGGMGQELADSRDGSGLYLWVVAAATAAAAYEIARRQLPKSGDGGPKSDPLLPADLQQTG